MADNYEDIINLPHHTSKKRKPMSPMARAAQFAPFAALVGYESEVKEAARLTDERPTLGEYEISVLNERINAVAEHLSEMPEVTLTCFVPDEKKSGGRLVEITGAVKKLNRYKRIMVLADGTEIGIDDIYKIEGDFGSALTDI